MPETVIPDRYVDQIPKFVLPKEFSNEPTEEKPKVDKAPEVKAVPAEAPQTPEVKEEPKGATEAVATEGEGEKPESEETTGKDPEKSSTRRFERRIDRAHRRAAEAQARAEQLSRELAELRAQNKPQVSSTAPRMEDFTDVQEYAKAFAEHQSNERIKDYEKKQRDQAEQARTTKLVGDWEERSAKSTHEDFDEVVGDIKPTTPWAVAIMRAENGPDIAYYLGSHQAEARKIFALDPVGQILEIGRLQLKLQAPAVPPKTPSKAPPPIEPVTTGGALSGTEIEPNMPYEKYLKVGNKMFRGDRGR